MICRSKESNSSTMNKDSNSKGTSSNKISLVLMMVRNRWVRMNNLVLIMNRINSTIRIKMKKGNSHHNRSNMRKFLIKLEMMTMIILQKRNRKEEVSRASLLIKANRIKNSKINLRESDF